MRRALVIAAAAGFGLFAACSSPSAHGTIEGTLTFSGGASSEAVPVPGVVTLVHTTVDHYEGPSTVETEQMVPVADDGTFSAEVPPGRYELIGSSPAFGEGSYTCDGGVIRVDVGSVSAAEVHCQGK